MSPLSELKVELRTFNSQKNTSNAIFNTVYQCSRPRDIAPCFIRMSRKLTAGVIRSVFQSLKIPNCKELAFLASRYYCSLGYLQLDCPAQFFQADSVAWLFFIHCSLQTLQTHRNEKSICLVMNVSVHLLTVRCIMRKRRYFPMGNIDPTKRACEPSMH